MEGEDHTSDSARPRPRTVSAEKTRFPNGRCNENQRGHPPNRQIPLLIFPMHTERKEPPTYIPKSRSPRRAHSRNFLDTRTRLNANVDRADNFLVKRFYNLDHNAYLDGPLPAKNKELMGLVASACLRCDDCINYHVIQSYRLGATRPNRKKPSTWLWWLEEAS